MRFISFDGESQKQSAYSPDESDYLGTGSGLQLCLQRENETAKVDFYRISRGGLLGANSLHTRR
jgi:hypothetical protein